MTMDPFLKDTLRESLLDATHRGDVKRVLYYLDKLPAEDMRTDFGENVLSCAAHNGHLEIIDILAQRGVDLHYFEEYALRKAAGQGHDKMVSYLLDKGADIHAMGDVALHWAVRAEKNSTVRLLLEHGANPKNLDEDLQQRCLEVKAQMDAEKKRRREEDRARKHENRNTRQQNIRSFIRRGPRR
ncbi:MAG: ankyrin repeat domain-containing protein [Micavibrio sp.]|nr:MAG: ankyrin repeat domain-containing protein [Micavibrio sp.]